MIEPLKRLPDFSGAARDLPIGLGPAAQMFCQELFDMLPEIQVVFRPLERVAFVRTNDVLHRPCGFSEGPNHPVRLLDLIDLAATSLQRPAYIITESVITTRRGADAGG
jgi:hypothetical protein